MHGLLKNWPMSWRHKNTKPKLVSGFTLVETLVVVGLMVLLLATGLFLGVDTFKNYTRRSERDVLVSVLTKARSRAMNNMYQTPHGVCRDSSSNYVIFRGSTYIGGASTNEEIPGNSAVTISGLPLCSSGGVLFSQLAGTTTDLTITITQDSRTSTIEVNEEGRIN